MLSSVKSMLPKGRAGNHLKYTIIILFLPALYVLTACTSPKRKVFKSVGSAMKAGMNENYFTGFLLIDPQSGDTIYKQNSGKYFTPASNTKIFTLYASLKLIPENIPSLKYIDINDTIYVEGTGDPTLLHSYFQHTEALDFLKDKSNIALHLNNFQDSKLGPGWSWDDYHYYYQPERGSFPLYGNVLTLFNFPNKTITPSYFSDSVVDLDFGVNREAEKNLFYYSSKRKDTVEIPIRTDSVLTKKLLEHALGKKIEIVHKMPTGERNLIYGIATDSVLKRMMHESDNFLAEQLLVLASSILTDTLNGGRARDYVLDELLNDLKQQPRWVDGSGLSRYNLFTPESLVHVLHKMYLEIPRERLFDLFPKGGVTGTLEDWYPGNPEPYIIAKTGSLGNNHCLSGYLLTKSGKTLIFSLMNNHFRIPSAEIKTRMQQIFEAVRDTY